MTHPRILCTHLLSFILMLSPPLRAEQVLPTTINAYYREAFSGCEILIVLLALGAFGGSFFLCRKVKLLKRQWQEVVSQKEKAEADAYKFFRVISGNPASIVITDAQGFIEYANPMFCKETGYTSNEVIGSKPNILKSDQTSPEVHHDLWQTIVKGEVWEGRLCNKRKNGSLYWEKACIGPIKDQNGLTTHYVGVKENIDQTVALEQRLLAHQANLEETIKQRTNELQESLEQTRSAQIHIDSILASVADGLLVTDRSDRIVLVNKVVEQFFKMRAERMVNTTLQELLARHALSFIDLNKAEIVGRAQRFDVELPTEELCGIRVLQATSSPVHDQSGTELGGTVTLFHDITKERELDRLKTEFVTTVAHELRTPLTSIQGFSKLLLEKTFSKEEEKKFHFYINQQAENLTNIISDLFDVSRIESGQGFVLVKKKTAMEPLLREIVELFQKQSPGHWYHLYLDEQQKLLNIDEEKVIQAVKNVLSNAVKYSPEGSHVTVEGKSQGDSYCIKISDKGIGMNPEQLAHIYDKFYRADTSNTAVGGTGLGMGIVRYIVEAHKGEMNIQSLAGTGTTVSITLPFGENSYQKEEQEGAESLMGAV